MKAKASARIMVQFVGDGTPGTYLVGIDVTNVGVRPFHVTSVGWRTGWLGWGPNVLKYRYAIQKTNIMLNQRPSPHIVDPGLHDGFYVTVADMKSANAEESRNEMFTRKLPVIGYCPIWAMVNITGRKPVMSRVPRDLAVFLRTGVHASTTDEN